MSRPTTPDFDYSHLALHAESGNNVLQFGRSSERQKRVGERAQAHRSRSGFPLQFAENAAGNRAPSPERQEAGLADSSSTPRRADGTYINGPESNRAGTAILAIAVLFAGFCLGVVAASAYIHFSGR